MKLKQLTLEEGRVILEKGTEPPFSGDYEDHWEKGVYICKQCGAPLYTSDTKFNVHCGWPSFDEEIEGAVTRALDIDGRRVEITCSQCGAHLGHVFEGEGFTQKNTRHCVNSISLEFKHLNSKM
jgi:peptide-methionine (R)-S-oxide reductase